MRKAKKSVSPLLANDLTTSDSWTALRLINSVLDLPDILDDVFDRMRHHGSKDPKMDLVNLCLHYR